MSNKISNHKFQIIKKIFLPTIALLLIGLVYFGINGVQAELSTDKDTTSKKDSADHTLNIVAVDNDQTPDVVSPSPIETKTAVEVSVAPEVKNIPATEVKSPSIRVTMRINAGSAAGNYPVDYLDGENAYQLLIRIAEKNHFSVQTKNYSWGIFVEGIGNLVQDGRDNFWFLYINGKSSEVGASDYTVKPNDLIEWRYHEWWTY